MSGLALSANADENLDGIPHQKREPDYDDEDNLVKKQKVFTVDVETDVTRENFLLPASNVHHSACPEQNCSKVDNVEQGFSGDITKDNRLAELSNSSEDKICCDIEALNKESCQKTCIEADAAEDKGSRQTMEDAWVILPDASLGSPGKLRCAHFAVFDGHGGRLAAEFAKKQLHTNVLSAGLPRELMDVKAAKKAIIEGFRRTDESLLQESLKGNWNDGATSVCVWVLGKNVFVANIGDAKAVLARTSITDRSQGLTNKTDSPLKAIVVTREHKAIFPQERARIQKAGGSVDANGRLQGRLEVSRAFGDRQFKKVGVVATPDVHSFELSEREHFMILGCDGLWRVFGPSDAVDFVRKQLEDNASATVVARRLVKEAVRERLCKDNCTAVVIIFRRC